MNNKKEYLIGFDARRMNLQSIEKWNDSRKAEYLINPNVRRVLSTDETVWPSLFKQRVAQSILEIEPKKRKEMFPSVDFENQTGPFAPEWIGPNNPFWDNLYDLRQHIALLNPAEEVWIIAGTCFIDDETRSKLEGTKPYGLPPYIEPMDPPERDPAWSLLGYDVSDSFRLSGLSNCGYKESDFTLHPREYWTTLLNEYHLFREFEPALEFLQLSSERIPEHAPFFVYGLYRIEILNAGQV